MKLHIGRVRRARQRRGIVIPYLAVAGVVLVGLMGLAVDMGRVQTAKTECRAAADAAARSGATALLYYGNWTETGGFSSNTNIVAAENAAISVMTNSRVDGTFMTSAMFSASNTSDNSRDLQVGNWNFTTHKFTTGRSPINAVQVSARRTTATSDPISLLFTAVLGRSTDDIFCTSVAAIANLTDGNANNGASSEVDPQTVKGNYNPYLAGAPAWSYKTNAVGTYASAPELGTKDSPNTNYDTVADGDAGKSDLYQNSDSNSATAGQHPMEFDVADPGNVGGNVTGTSDTSESPLRVETTSNADIPLQAGEVIQINAPLPTGGSTVNEVNNSNNPVTTDANGYVDGNAPTTSEVFEDVGAINNSADMATYQSGDYDAANPDPQAHNTSGNNTTQAQTTNLPASTGDDDVIQGSENNLTNVAAPLNSMMGVFLPPVPTSGPNAGVTSPLPMENNAPPGYDFTSDTARNYDTLSPSAQQVFYTGSGQTNNGVRGEQQSIVVPAAAAGGRFFLGSMDGQEWANNTGAFTGITINAFTVRLVQ
jgi:hypothetical protein